MPRAPEVASPSSQASPPTSPHAVSRRASSTAPSRSTNHAARSRPSISRFGESGSLKTKRGRRARRLERAPAPRPHAAACRAPRRQASSRKKGSTSTEDITLETTDDLLDLLAVVAYEHAPALAGKRVRWSVDGLRRRNGLEPHVLEHDKLAGHRVERFAITREA